MGSEVSKILKQIDDGPEHKCNDLIDELFAKFDKDGSKKIDKKEYDAFIDSVTDYVVEDFKKHGTSGYDRPALRTFVQKWLDPNSDKEISREELQENLKAVLDTVD